MIQGINDLNFYKLIEGSILNHGFGNLADFFREAPKYFNDEKDWQKVYNLASYENPTRLFTQTIGERQVPIMATYLSDDAETPTRGNKGVEKQVGDIPRMGQGYFFSTKTYEDIIKFSRTANDAFGRAWESLLVDTALLVKGVHAQRSFTGYQIESLGSYTTNKVNNNGGIQSITINVNKVADNEKKCGGFSVEGYTSKGTKNAWSSSSANPVGDLEDMWKYAKSNRLLSSDPKKAVFRMSEAAYNTLRDHSNTKTKVAMWKSGYLIDAANVQYYQVTDADLKGYLEGLGLPAIEKVDYYGYMNYFDSASMSIKDKEIAAFDVNTVVLRYAGKFGEFQWSRVSNLFETADAPVYYTDNNSIAIQQDTKVKGIRYSAESLCAPVPYYIEKVLYLKINQAAD